MENSWLTPKEVPSRRQRCMAFRDALSGWRVAHAGVNSPEGLVGMECWTKAPGSLSLVHPAVNSPLFEPCCRCNLEGFKFLGHDAHVPIKKSAS